MRLYFLRPTDKEREAWPRYDVALSFIVRAPSEAKARRLAAARCGDEGRAPWLSKRRTPAIEVLRRGVAEIILQDFRAG